MDKTTTQSSVRIQIGFILYSLSLVIFLVVMGGNIYQIIAEVPNWSANIPNSLADYRKLFHITHAGYFFQTLVPLTLVSLIIAVILLWNRPKNANRWMLLSLGGALVAEIFTGIYFMPRNFLLFIDPLEGIPVEQLKTAAVEWQTANYVRTAIVIFTVVAFLKSYKIISKEH